MTVERLYKYKKKRNNGKGGLGFVWYAFNMYEKHLFPYYIKLRELNSGKEVWVIKDNIGVYHKARRLIGDLIDELGIKF